MLNFKRTKQSLLLKPPLITTQGNSKIPQFEINFLLIILVVPMESTNVPDGNNTLTLSVIYISVGMTLCDNIL